MRGAGEEGEAGRGRAMRVGAGETWRGGRVRDSYGKRGYDAVAARGRFRQVRIGRSTTWAGATFDELHQNWDGKT